jgi:hypothetical protein
MYYRVSLDWLSDGGGEPIVVESPEEAQALGLLRQAPEHVRQAVLTLLRSASVPDALSLPPPAIETKNRRVSRPGKK